jgi:hypothetical protein
MRLIRFAAAVSTNIDPPVEDVSVSWVELIFRVRRLGLRTSSPLISLGAMVPFTGLGRDFGRLGGPTCSERRRKSTVTERQDERG